MKLNFTKMHGAGNDFVVLNATQAAINLSPSQYRFIADRHFGVGADQILIVGPGNAEQNIDFTYRIVNADGGEVEQCGNGARCFMRYVHDKGLSHKKRLRVQTRRNIIEPELHADGRITVDMGAPVFVPAEIPFIADDLTAQPVHQGHLWSVDFTTSMGNESTQIAVVSMGNPHAVLLVNQIDQAPVALWGAALERHPRFPERVNVGFMEIVNRSRIKLRVFERGVGETLACGTGACAAAVSGIALNWLDTPVQVDTLGGCLTIEWHGIGDQVKLTGPALKVFEGVIEIPDANATTF